MPAAPVMALAEARSTPRTAILLIGVTAVVAQVVLLREMLAICHGNELSLGFVLAAWLAWTAFGSGLLGRLGRGPRLIPCLFLATAVALPLALLALRQARSWWHAAPGETLGPAAILASAVAGLAFFCPISGWLIATAMRTGGEGQAHETAARAYLCEALGSAAGGLCAALLLLRRFSPLEIAACLVVLNLIAAFWLLARAWLVRAIAAVAAVAMVVVALPWLRALELNSVARDWPGFHVVALHPSRYGQLAMLSNEGVATVVENGQPLFSAPDLPSAESAVHLALVQHSAPAAVLLIGGGPGGALVEVLKHRTVRRLDYLELDPAILEFAGHLPDSEVPLRDPRVHAHAVDGRLFLRRSTESYDAIILNLPEPQNAQLNRFYTVEFFRDAAAHLSAGGVLSLQVRGAENYVSPQLAGFLASLRLTLTAAFPRVVVLPGDPARFFAGGRAASLTSDAAELSRRLEARHVSTLYVRDYYTAYDFSAERVRGLESRLAAAPATVNRDFAPSAYYFDVLLWSEQFGGWYRDAFSALARVPTAALIAVVLVVASLAAFAIRSRTAELPRAAAFAVVLMGFTLMALQILLLLAFQAVYGYVFEHVALIAAACMAGLGLGTWLALRLVPADRPPRRALFGLQAAAALSPLSYVAIVQLVAGARAPAAVAIAAYGIFPALALLSGAIAGAQFPLALRAFVSAGARRAGTLYALDLLGSCLGALLLSTYFVPVYGFAATAALVAIANVPAIALLLPSFRVAERARH